MTILYSTLVCLRFEADRRCIDGGSKTTAWRHHTDSFHALHLRSDWLATVPRYTNLQVYPHTGSLPAGCWTSSALPKREFVKLWLHWCFILFYLISINLFLSRCNCMMRQPTSRAGFTEQLTYRLHMPVFRRLVNAVDYHCNDGHVTWALADPGFPGGEGMNFHFHFTLPPRLPFPSP